jgi:hypothetical protein
MRSESKIHKHDTAEDSLRKLREAAEALGLDPVKINDLVDSARASVSPTSMPKIEEEPSSTPTVEKQPSVVRRTIILASDPPPLSASSLGRRNSARRSLALTESTFTKPPSHRRDTSEVGISEETEQPGPVMALKSVKDRVPTVSLPHYLLTAVD